MQLSSLKCVSFPFKTSGCRRDRVITPEKPAKRAQMALLDVPCP